MNLRLPQGFSTCELPSHVAIQPGRFYSLQDTWEVQGCRNVRNGAPDNRKGLSCWVESEVPRVTCTNLHLYKQQDGRAHFFRSEIGGKALGFTATSTDDFLGNVLGYN